MSTELRHLKVLLTGGAQGIGRGLLRHFLSAGHEVVILDSNVEELEHLKTQAKKWNIGRNGHWHGIKCDLSKREDLRQAVSIVKERFGGRLDVLINNAFPTTLALNRVIEGDKESVEDDWDKMLAVGLTAPFLLSRLCVPLLAAGQSTPDSPGTIINVSSTRAYQAEGDHEAYSTVKAGLLGFTQCLSVSLGHRHKIRVNSIIPGWIHVASESKGADDTGASWDYGLTDEDKAWHPAGRVGKADDVAKAADYLITSGFVTGQEIVVDGGVGKKMVYPE